MWKTAETAKTAGTFSRRLLQTIIFSIIPLKPIRIWVSIPIFASKTMNSMKKILLPLILMSAFLVSCEKPENNEQEPEYVISVRPSELFFGAEGGEQTVTITSKYGEEDAEWRISMEGECDWCYASVSNGGNGDEVILSAEPYDKTTDARTVNVTFSCGDKTANLTITQNPEKYFISVEPTILTFDAAGGDAEVSITCTDNWYVRDGDVPDWITLSEESGESGTAVTVFAAYNASADTLYGTITFRCGDKKAEVAVTQKADDSPVIQFKDQYFLEALLATYTVSWNGTEYFVDVDKNKDGMITENEALSVEVLDLSKALERTRHGFLNADELIYFTQLRYLDIGYSYAGIEVSIDSLDLCNLSKLEYLYAHSTNLTSINICGCSALTYLYCWGNQLTSIDLSTNTALTYLYIHEELTSLDLRHNTVLKELDCSGNNLTTLDLGTNTSLTFLNLAYNKLTSIDLSRNTALTKLDCSNIQLTSLDLSNCTSLTELYCSNTQLTSIDLSRNTALTVLNCHDNPQLTLLNLSNCTALIELDCSGCKLSTINLINNTALVALNCSENQLSSLNLSTNTALNQLECYNNHLTSLDLSNNSGLNSLYCGLNKLTSLDLSNLIILGYLNCDNNQLTSLDLSSNEGLLHLYCDYNQLTSLDLHLNRHLERLSCKNNPLQKLIIYKHHTIDDYYMNPILSEYGDIIEYWNN